ncbi:amidophosphoribosyltransferase [Aneurinibacillus uraniidurans]|uniref:amidophosphoribosyltransferase n=1 Tax=Aneurinibacillus uraniidurans TaxID=2966586 RepID=UPI00234990EE|nr:amidophosphoribosyltransferase [Aneurinibacillus sp. B1]WCN37496.1 amidophosphoribosyltransferase [Aneurinibacillus sp. B1]
MSDGMKFEHDDLWDKLNEECGVFGVYNHPDAPQITYYGIHALQHRGQESAGICASNGEVFSYHRGMGLVTEAFNGGQLEEIHGKMAIGHVRYTTAGESKIENAQPLVFKYTDGNLALAHNGNLVNADQVRHQLERQGSIFQTTSDTEVIAHLIARSGYEIEEAVRHALGMIKGAYALLVMTEKKLIVALDPNGLRPLVLGRMGDGGYVVSSETCAFDTVGAEVIRDVEPGEMIIIDENGLRSERFAGQAQRATCSFEYIYFARPDSDIGGINVHLARKELGRQLFREAPVVEADIVTGVPDSSTSAAIGYAEAAGLPYELGLIKNRYVGRTFIQPTQEMRARGVRMKLSAVRKVVEGKRVVMIDDSIVRGTTSGRIVSMLREAGAKEVHVRISSPPVKNPCFYGIDTSSREELIAATKSLEEIREMIGADSLYFLSPEGMIDAIGQEDSAPNRGHCLACFTGQYPTEIYEDTKNCVHK